MQYFIYEFFRPEKSLELCENSDIIVVITTELCKYFERKKIMSPDRFSIKVLQQINNNQAENMLACAFVVNENENQAEEQERERIHKFHKMRGMRLS